MIASETYWSIVTNPPHIGAELTWSVLLDIILLPFIKLAVLSHDRKHHGGRWRRYRGGGRH